ncbi:MAG: leucine-rich repeat domain-containing protein [Candidatus Aminicenantes bacterium]|nr:leucine-rich repeat domain-containing protein [Candidatus Aminicenantes bacterium]
MTGDLKLIHQLAKETGVELKPGDFDQLTDAEQNGYSIDETGAVTGLVLRNVKANDFSLLRQMKSLTHLDLAMNNIEDISFLRGLKRIAHLNLGWNRIKNISPLADLVDLLSLDLRNNQLKDIEPLRSLHSIKHLDLQGNSISDISTLEELCEIIYLNISNNKIIDIASIRGLTRLNYLDAAGNQIDNISAINQLTGLVYLNLTKNQILEISPVRELTDLAVLNLGRNRISGIAPLEKLSKLTRLDLSLNRITDLTPLKDLKNLTELYLFGNQITDLTPLRELTNLTDLNLKINQITDLTTLRKLKNLTVLNLHENELTDLTPLQDMAKLEELYLSKNKIMKFTVLSSFKNLKRLGLGANQITDLNIKPLIALTNLETLALYENQITDISPLRELKNLKVLDVRRNRIEKLPPEIITWWPNLEIKWVDNFIPGLLLLDNPLTDPPAEIVKKGTAAVKNYFAEMEGATVLFLETKLLLVGSGDVGKTSLMKKLKDNSFVVEQGKEVTTPGVDIQLWQLTCTFPDNQIHNVNIHFWDFGGQEILHATHQFFLTKRSLYLFVWDPRKEGEIQSFDYWLNAVKILAAESPVIVVMNKSEQRIKQIAESAYKDKFPNIRGFLQVSCVTGQRIPELTEIIRTTLSGMPHLLDRLPKRWMDIRDALKSMDRDYISLDDYFKVCRSQGMNDEKALFLSDYLHDLGIILHFHEDSKLTDTVILKPEWATKAVYALIDSLDIQKNNGKFNHSDICKYWDAGTYPKDKHFLLLRLMEKFELCFKIVGTDDYIIPELLQTERRDIDFASYSSPLNLHYSYDFMPAGIITRFISRIHYLVRDAHYWKNGVELAFDNSNALVVSDSLQKRIRVSVSGQSPDQLMAIIRSHFDHIHETLNMEKEKHVFEEVPCSCHECVQSKEPHFYKYDVLRRLAEKGKDARCDKSLDDIPTEKLLKGLKTPEKPANLFDNLVTIASQIHGISKTLQPDENSRNTVVALLLNTIGFRVKDQTLWSRSASASPKRPGELDIKVEDEDGRTVSIIEALNLGGWNQTTTDEHIKKIHVYDCNGVKENFILVYATAPDFPVLCKQYRENLSRIEYQYPLIGEIEDTGTGFNKIKAYRTRHRCNEGETLLYHILVEM